MLHGVQLTQKLQHVLASSMISIPNSQNPSIPRRPLPYFSPQVRLAAYTLFWPPGVSRTAGHLCACKCTCVWVSECGESVKSLWRARERKWGVPETDKHKNTKRQNTPVLLFYPEWWGQWSVLREHYHCIEIMVWGSKDRGCRWIEGIHSQQLLTL